MTSSSSDFCSPTARSVSPGFVQASSLQEPPLKRGKFEVGGCHQAISPMLQTLRAQIEMIFQSRCSDLQNELRRQIADYFASIVAPVVSKFPLPFLFDLFNKTLLTPARNTNPEDPCKAFPQPNNILFIKLFSALEAISFKSLYGRLVINLIGVQALNPSFSRMCQTALERLSIAKTDFEKAVVIHDTFSNPSTASGAIDVNDYVLTDKALTRAFERAIGDKCRKMLSRGSLLFYTKVINDGVGDLVHLAHAREAIAPVFGAAAEFLAFEESPSGAKHQIHHDILERSRDKIRLIRGDSGIPHGAMTHPQWLDTMFRTATHLFCISQEQHSGMDNLDAGKPKSCIREILPAKIGVLSMGLKSAGIWFFDPPADPEISLLHASESLKADLGCSGLDKNQLAEWYRQTVINMTMVYKPAQDDRAIFASLAIVQAKTPAKRRVVFKTKQLPQFLCEPLSKEERVASASVRPKVSEDGVRLLERYRVMRIVVDNEEIFRRVNVDEESEGIELCIITKRFENADWSIYKSLVNGLIGVGGDNTLSEALSNPSTWPPLMFAQYPDKQEAYCEVIELAKELPDTVPGKGALVSYLEVVKKLAYWAAPADFACELVKAIDGTDDKTIREAWKKLVGYARQVSNLAEFIVPLVSEEVILARFPGVKHARMEIMSDASLALEQKEQAYITLLQSDVASRL